VLFRSINAPKWLVANLSGEERLGSGTFGKIGVLFDERETGYIIGRTGFLEPLLGGTWFQTAEGTSLTTKYNAILGEELDESEIGSQLAADVSRITLRGLKEALAALVVSPESEVLDLEVKVKLPSENYCRGFFNLSRIEGAFAYRHLLGRWIISWLRKEGSDVVVCIGEHIGKLVTHLPIAERIIVLPLGAGPALEIQSALGLSSESKVLLITDVLGTGTTVRQALSAMQNVLTVSVIAVVDASNPDSELPGKEITLVDCVIRKRLEYFTHLPSDWRASEVRRVDPKTHLLIQLTGEAAEALWKAVKAPSAPGQGVYHENAFLTEICTVAGGVSWGHYASETRHITYLFNIGAIARRFGVDIAALIESDVREAYGALSPSHVFYPGYNPGMSLIARQVGLRFRQSRVEGISREELVSESELVAQGGRNSSAARP
jgi:hypothetical protein